MRRKTNKDAQLHEGAKSLLGESFVLNKDDKKGSFLVHAVLENVVYLPLQGMMMLMKIEPIYQSHTDN